jgi:hypothetical protein
MSIAEDGNCRSISCEAFRHRLRRPLHLTLVISFEPKRRERSTMLGLSTLESERFAANLRAVTLARGR